MSSPSGRAIPRSRNRSRRPRGSRPRYTLHNERGNTPPAADLYSRMHLTSPGQNSSHRSDLARSRDSTAATIAKLLPEYDDAIYNLLRKGYTFGDLVELFHLDKYILRDSFEKRGLNIIVQRSNRTMPNFDHQPVTYNLRNSGALGEVPGLGGNESYGADFTSSSVEPDNIISENLTISGAQETDNHPLNNGDTSPKDTDNDRKKNLMKFPSKPAGMQHILSPTTPANDMIQTPTEETNVEDSNGDNNVAQKELMPDHTLSNLTEEDTIQENDITTIAPDNAITQKFEIPTNNTVIIDPVKQDVIHTTEITNPTTTEPKTIEPENEVVDTADISSVEETNTVPKKVQEPHFPSASDSIQHFNEERMAASEREAQENFAIYGIIDTTTATVTNVPENNIELTPTVITNKLGDVESGEPTAVDDFQIQTNDNSANMTSKNIEPIHTLNENEIGNGKVNDANIPSPTESERENVKSLSSAKRNEQHYNGLNDTHDDIPQQEDQPMDHDKFYDSDTPLSCMQVYKEDDSVDDQYMEASAPDPSKETNDFDENMVAEELPNGNDRKQSNGHHSNVDKQIENVQTNENDDHDENIAVNPHTKHYPDNNAAKEIEALLQSSYPFNLSTIDMKNEGEVIVANKQSDEDNNANELAQDNVEHVTEADTLDQEKEITKRRSKFAMQLSEFERSQRNGLELLKKVWNDKPNPSINFHNDGHFRSIVRKLRGLAREIQQFGNTMEFEHSHGTKNTKVTKQPRSKAIIKQETQVQGLSKLTKKQRAELAKNNFEVNPNIITVVPPSELGGQNISKQPVVKGNTKKARNENLKSKQKENKPIQNLSTASVFEINPLYTAPQTQPIAKTSIVQTNSRPIHNNPIKSPEVIPEQKLQASAKNPFYDTTKQINAPNNQIGLNHINPNNVDTRMEKVVNNDNSNNSTETVVYGKDHIGSHIPNQTRSELPRENSNLIAKTNGNTQNILTTSSFSSEANNNISVPQQNVIPSNNNEVRTAEIFTKKLNKYIGETPRDIDQFPKGNNTPIVQVHNSLPQRPNNPPITTRQQGQDPHYANLQTASTTVRGVPAKKMSRRLLKQQRAARQNISQPQENPKGTVQGVYGQPGYATTVQPLPQSSETTNGRQGPAPDRISNQPYQGERSRYIQPSNVNDNQLQQQPASTFSGPSQSQQPTVDTNTKLTEPAPQPNPRTDVASNQLPPQSTDFRSTRLEQHFNQNTSKEITRPNYDPIRNAGRLPVDQQVGRADLGPNREPSSNTGEFKTSDGNRNVTNALAQSTGLSSFRGVTNNNVLPLPRNRKTNIDSAIHRSRREIISNKQPLSRKKGRYQQARPVTPSRYSNSYINRQPTGLAEGQSKTEYPSQVPSGNFQPKRDFSSISNPSMNEPLQPAPKKPDLPQDNQTGGEWDRKDESRIVDNSFIQLSKVCTTDSLHI